MVKHIHVPIPNQRSESATSRVIEEGAVRTALTLPPPESIRNAPRATDGHTWAMACGAPIGGLLMCERTQKPSLSPAECPQDALISVRRVGIIAEDRLILIGSRENRQ